jgi:hypothetical protein
MTFASPIWLIGLLPWAAVVVYLLWGRRRQEGVPFLYLWLGPVEGPRPKRRFAAPPLALAFAILSMLLALLGAARPVMYDPLRGNHVTIVIDRGATMSAQSAGRARYVEAAAALETELARLGARTPVDLVEVPGLKVERTDVSDWIGSAARLERTAVDTGAALRTTVARRLAEASGPVIVLTDQGLPADNGRLVRVPPPSVVRNAGIVLLAARETPRPQVMVRVRNGTDQATAELRVSADGREVMRAIDLPAPGGATRDYFVDVEGLGDVVKAELDLADDFGGDDAAWLVRAGSPPRIEPRGSLPPELRRMIEVYTSSRPPASDAPRVVVVRDLAALPPGSAGVVLAAGQGAPLAPSEAGVRPHPVTRNTEWGPFESAARLADPPPGDWTPVVTVGGRPAVAVREAPARQVWVGIESDDWSRRPAYVVFWASVFDWLGGGESRFASHPVGRLEGNWRVVERFGAGGSPPVSSEPGLWPGLYERVEDGARRAVNAGGVNFPATPRAAWQSRLAELARGGAGGGGTPLWPGVLVAAVACAAGAAMSWKGRNLTAFSARRTVPG